MGSLQNARIDQSYPGLIKTNDEAAIGATEKVLQDGSGNNSTLALGTGSASFTGTLDLSGATVTGLPAGVDSITAGTGISVDQSTGNVTVSSTVSNTTYDLASAQAGANATVTLTGSDASSDAITLAAGTNITLTDNGSNQITIDAAGGGGAAGVVSGTGADSITVSSAVVTNPSTAAGSGAIALGDNASAAGTQNITIGQNSDSNGTNIINIGDNNDMSQYCDNSVLIRPGGGTSLIFRSSSVAIGANTYPGDGGVAIGLNARGNSNDPSVAIGKDATADQDGVAVGGDANADGSDSVAIGRDANADNTAAVAISDADATGAYCIAIGSSARASNTANIMIGLGGSARGDDNIMIGHDAGAGAGYDFLDNRIALGKQPGVGADSIIIGNLATSPNTGSGYITLGHGASSTASGAVAIGNSVTAETADTVTIKKLQMLDYASLNYANDSQAAAGGIPLGGVYHHNGNLKIRTA